MSLSKEIEIDKIEVVAGGAIQVRQVTKIVENGDVLSQSYHRWTLAPGQDLTGQEPKVVAIAEAAWTPEVVAAYQAQVESYKLG